MLAAVGRPRFLPEARADLQRLHQLRDPRRHLRVLVAVRAVLDLFPSGADAELEAPTGHVVHTGRDLREQRRVPVRLRGDHRTDADLLRVDGEGGQQRPRFEAVGRDRIRAEEQMVGDPERAKMRALALARDRHDVRVAEAELRLDLNAEIHQPFSSVRRACSSSSAVSRNIMCLPVTVSVASMKPAKAATPALTYGSMPSAIASNPKMSAAQIANVASVSRS